MTTIPRILLALSVTATALAVCSLASADSSRTVDWRTVAPASGRVVGKTVRVVATGSTVRYPLVVIERPGVADRYAVKGRVRYARVRGTGFLEMWSVFGDGSRYFTRTLAGAGSLKAISGSSAWRGFALPFDADGSRPVRLEIALVLPSRGTVWVGPLTVGPLTAGSASTAAWWSDRTAGVAGAVIGVALGLLGAFVGWATTRGRSRRLVVGLSLSLGVMGVVLLVGAVAALAASQPYAVWFPLLLGGALLTLVFGGAGLRARRSYSGLELRRMRAMDV
jgi:hypothetical protein